MSSTRAARWTFGAMSPRIVACASLIWGMLGVASTARAQSVRVLDRADYLERVKGMWLGECIADWTGLQTEGRAIWPPFLTDADWNTTPPGFPPWVFIDYYLYWDPWAADDDTDIEYVYLHLLDQHGANRLNQQQLFDGWELHINRAIWASNAAARELMSLGVRPPATSLAQGMRAGLAFTVDQSLMIDAQLTTEFFGALCPGLPGQALEMAAGPIGVTARGHSAHAAEFHVALYSLAFCVPQQLEGAKRVLWLVREARKYIPDSSKSADAVDFVVAEYLANPDKDDWELTRDRLWLRFGPPGPDNPGWTYRGWFESTINLATGVMALLYGEGDFRKTVRVGTLSGWDSDNGTATMGGLLGLLLGDSGLRAQFTWNMADDYWISRTRDAMPDHVPDDAVAEDTFELMARRMRAIADREVAAAGGQVAQTREAGLAWFGNDGGWLLPPGGGGEGISAIAALELSPTSRLMHRGANNRVRAEGGTVSAQCSVACTPGAGMGSPSVALVGNGYEHDFAGLEDDGARRGYFSTHGCDLPPGTTLSLSVEYDRAVEVERVRFIEGDHFAAGGGSAIGGWFDSLSLEIRIDGVWTSAAFALSEPLNPTRPFQIIDLALTAPVMATGVRIAGPASAAGTQGFVTCMELDALATEATPAAPSYDLNADGAVDVEDLVWWALSPSDLNGDSAADSHDAELLRDAVRWGEPGQMRSR